MDFEGSLWVWSKLFLIFLGCLGGDDYPKYVVTMADISGLLKEYPGINHIHLGDFLKMEF